MSAPTLLTAHHAAVGPDSSVRRLLPQVERRRVGAFCFFDHFGPVPAGGGGMSVGPHPHTGLQTATWLFEGEVLHLDSTGARAAIRPGALNLMTAGRGIAHTEDLGDAPRGLHGMQFWIALPDAERHRTPGFAHHADLPTTTVGDARVTVAIGALCDRSSPAQVFSPLVLAEVVLPAGGAVELPLNPAFEHGIAVGFGEIGVEGLSPTPDQLLVLPEGRDVVALSARTDTKLLLFGGTPFPEPILMSWNWVLRDADELVAVRDAWERGEGHGDLGVFADRRRLSAPPLVGRPVAR